MRDTVFPRWQGAFLAIFLLADGLYVPATPAAVHTLVLGGLLATAVTFLWLKLLSSLGERDLESLCLHKFPHLLTRALFLAVGAFCLLGMLWSLVRLSAFWQETAFPAIPRFLTAAVLLFVGCVSDAVSDRGGHFTVSRCHPARLRAAASARPHRPPGLLPAAAFGLRMVCFAAFALRTRAKAARRTGMYHRRICRRRRAGADRAARVAGFGRGRGTAALSGIFGSGCVFGRRLFTAR